jgi:putative peptide zinc metalloprotease protein
MAVGAGGMIFELAIAGAAVHLFINAPDAQIRQLAFNAMLTASISTVFFNANPLMRFDGYYILSDVLEVPNLMQRSNRMLLYLAQKFIYRVENLRPPTTDPAERSILIVYGILAVAYRVFLFFTITLYVLGQFFALGLVLAIWSAAAWFLIPIGKFVHWLASSAQLADRRMRAIVTSIALAATTWVGLGMIRAPDHRRASGVVESVNRSGVFFGANCEVVEVHKRLGDHVKKGDLIARCEAPSLDSGLALARAQLAEAQAKEREYTASDSSAAQVARKMIETHEVTIAKMLELLAELEVRSPQDGVLVAGVGGNDPGSVAGVFVRRGQLLCEVVDTDNIRIAATVDTSKARPLMELPVDAVEVEFRSVARPYEVIRGGTMRLIQAGGKRLPHAALGFQGGGTIEIDPQDQQGLTTRTSEFTVYIDQLAAPGGGEPWRGVPGERVTVRFRLPSKPLLAQWWHRFEKLLQGRADI